MASSRPYIRSVFLYATRRDFLSTRHACWEVWCFQIFNKVHLTYVMRDSFWVSAWVVVISFEDSNVVPEPQEFTAIHTLQCS